MLSGEDEWKAGLCLTGSRTLTPAAAKQATLWIAAHCHHPLPELRENTAFLSTVLVAFVGVMDTYSVSFTRTSVPLSIQPPG